MVGALILGVVIIVNLAKATGVKIIYIEPTATATATPHDPGEAPMPPPMPPAFLTAFPSDGSGRLSGRLQHNSTGGWILNTAVDDYVLLGRLPDEFVAAADGREVILHGEWDRSSGPDQTKWPYTPTCIEEAPWLDHGPTLDKVGVDCDTIER
ncbi:hypothetical protein KBD09_03630 [Candidatus Woesebacteria bacterium]|nr:hypothetical protein [Candidatus Woesebacteria bacterium]